MGAQHLKLEVETIQLQQPLFGGLGSLNTISPVKTEADPVLVGQIAAQVGQLTVAVGAIHQAILGQAFTRPATQASAAEGAGLVEEVRKLAQRVEELETRNKG